MFILPLSNIKFYQNYNSQNRNNINFSYLKPLSCDSFSFKGKISKNLFDNYKPVLKKLGNKGLTVHNNEIAKRLLPEYTKESFQNLFDFGSGVTRNDQIGAVS